MGSIKYWLKKLKVSLPPIEFELSIICIYMESEKSALTD